MKTLLFAVVFAVLETASAQPVVKGYFAEPEGVELDKFPLKTGPLSVKEQERLGLAPARLERPTVVQNHFRNIRPDDRGRFILETLPPDTPVLVDKNGNLRYKADCGNRIVEVEPPLSSGGLGGVHYPQGPNKSVGTESKSKDLLKGAGTGKSFMQSLIDDAQAAAARIWNFLWDLLKWMFWALVYVIGCGLIAAIAAALYFIVRDTINRWRQGRPGPTSPVASTTETPATAVGTETQRVTVAPEKEPTQPRASSLQAVPARGTFSTSQKEAEPAAPKRRLRVDVSDNGKFYAKMKGYRSILVEEDSDGGLIIHVDPPR